MNRRSFAANTLALAGFSRFAGLSASGLLIAPSALAQTAQFIAMRSWLAPEYLRLAIEYKGLLLVDTFQTEQGNPRLVVDIQGLTWSPTVQQQLNAGIQNNPWVDRVRAASHNQGVVRVVLDLKQAIVADVATVTAKGGYQDRLLIDIYPANVDAVASWLAAQKNQHNSQQKDSSSPANLGQDKPYQHSAGGTRDTPLTQNTKQVDTGLKPPQASNTNARRAIKRKVLAIDPGHGGEDPGAIGPGGTQEKDVVLSIALQLAKQVRAQLGWEVVLTRDDDYFVPLALRVKKARAAQADLFVSIHADAFFTPTARGASVFALSEKGASSAAAKWIANKENDADLVGGLNLSNKDKQLTSVMLDLSTSAQIRSSLSVGKSLVKQLSKVATMHKKTVEQAGFAVLKAPDIPSLLIETAFISHPEEERALMDPKHQNKLVRAVVKAIATI